VDAKYMDICQVMTGTGGWPLSAFLTSEGEEFFAGTYFPPEGFQKLIERSVELWGAEETRAVLAKQAGEIVSLLSKASNVAWTGGEPSPAIAESAFEAFRAAHDREHGGFGGAPKFPRTSVLDFLLRYAWRTGDASATEIVTRTLDAMLLGGIRDHLGGGFH